MLPLVVFEEGKDTALSELIARHYTSQVQSLGAYNSWAALTHEAIDVITATSYDSGFEPLRQQILAKIYPSCMTAALEHPDMAVITTYCSDCTTCPLASQFKGRAGLACRLQHGNTIHGVLCASVPEHLGEDDQTRDAFFAMAKEMAAALDALVNTEALRRTEQKLSGIYRAAPTGILHVHNDKIREVNRALADMTGYDIADLIGADTRILFASEPEYDRWIRMTRRDVSGPTPATMETNLRGKDGRLINVDVRAVPLNPDTPEEGLIVSLLDITEQTRFAAQMRDAQKYESLGILAGGLAHDFNNLLMAILGNVELAMDELPPTSTGTECLHEATRAIHKAADLCRQMLAYSGHSAVLSRQVDAGKMLREMQELILASISKKASLKLTLPDTPIYLEADPNDIQQIIMNLVLNASEALEDKSGEIHIMLDEIQSGGNELGRKGHSWNPEPGPFARLRIIDSGCGIPPSHIDKLYDPFFTTKFMGRGLGLSAVHGIVRARRGAIQVESEPDRGTTISVFLPLIHPRPAEAAPSPPPQLPKSTRTILFVEDDEELRSLGESMIQHMGHQAITAENGKEAVDIYGQRGAEIDLVILDLTMPVMDGAEALAELRRINPEVKIALASGYNRDQLALRFAHANLVGFLQKPYTRGNFSELVEQISLPSTS